MVESQPASDVIHLGDAGRLRRLQVILEIIRRSDAALQENSDIGNGLAISLLHDAVEHSLYLALLSAHKTPAKREEFKGLVASVAEIYETKAQSQMPFQRHLENLNRVRIEFKHHGHVPNRGTSLELCENARQFATVLIRDLLKIDIENFHPTALLRTQVIQECLKSALEALAEGEPYHEAMQSLAEANWHLDTALGIAFPHPSRPLHVEFNLRNIPGFDQVVHQIMNFVVAGDRGTLFTSTMVASGMDAREHAKLRAKLPGISRTLGGKVQYKHTWPYRYTAEDVHSGVGQITRVTLWLEERFPTLQHDGKKWMI